MTQLLKLLALVSILSLGALGAEFPAAPQPSNSLVPTTLSKSAQPLIAAAIQPKAVSTKSFWALASLNSALTVADIELTQNCLSTIPGCREANPLYGTHPGRMRMYAINVPITAGINYLSYRVFTGKYKTRLWALPQASLGVSHLAGVMTNIAVRTR